jgi:hypothetical protein
MPLVEPPTPRRHDRLVAALVRVTKPLFRLHLALYEREVARAPFPRDARRTMVDGPDPDRLLFVGSIAVEGFGVLDHDLTCASQTARLVAAGRSRGVTWNEVSSPVLTAAEAARTDLPAEPADAAVVLLGICDVLLATGGTSWEASLRRLAVRVRESAGPDCRVVYVGIPPMAEFRPIPPVAARLLTRQIDRLNAVTARVALTTPGASWVPFPEWRSEGLYHQELLSWATMHRRWGQAIAPTVVASLGGVGAVGGPREDDAPAPAPRGDDAHARHGSDAGPGVAA